MWDASPPNASGTSPLNHAATAPNSAAANPKQVFRRGRMEGRWRHSRRRRMRRWSWLRRLAVRCQPRGGATASGPGIALSDRRASAISGAAKPNPARCGLGADGLASDQMKQGDQNAGADEGEDERSNKPAGLNPEDYRDDPATQ